MTLSHPMFPPSADQNKCSKHEHLEPLPKPAAQPDVDLYIRTDIPPETVFQALGRLRSEAEEAIERLLAIVDAIDADPDLEPAGDELDPSGDECEPELGSVDGRKGFDQSTWSAGADAVDGGEPALGASENHPEGHNWNRYDQAPRRSFSGSQLGWATGNADDREHCADREEDDSHDGREPDVEDEPLLGSFDRLTNQDHGWRQTAGGAHTWPAYRNCDSEVDRAERA